MLCEETLSAVVVAARASGGCRNHPATVNRCFMEAVTPSLTGAVALSHDASSGFPSQQQGAEGHSCLAKNNGSQWRCENSFGDGEL